MKSLHFGAGNIGRGFIGRSLSESGFSVVFADVNQDIVDSINNNREYFVRIVGNDEDNIVNIKNISAINSNDPKIIKLLASSDLITTAVGPNALDKLASIISRGIILKEKIKSVKMLNIIACENKVKASSYLKKIVLKNLPRKYHDYCKEYIGFVDCSIDTIIPTNFNRNKNQNDLFLTVENFKEWIVNASQFKGIIPKIIDMKLSDNLDPFIERKLFTLNTGHAIASYLGLVKKYQTIQEAISDKKICYIVKQSMKESGEVLIKRYNFNKNDHLSYINRIFTRFKNPFLSDKLERIARNPLQKLGKKERLIKPILRSLEYNLPYSNLVKGTASAFHYYNQDDLESIKICSLIKKIGIKRSIEKICDLSEKNEIVNCIVLEYMSIKKYI